MGVPFIVFEGPDMCGKSSHIDSVVKLLRDKGYNFVPIKFPVYKGFTGDEILDHLKNFSYDKKHLQEMYSDLFNHATNLWVNKTAYLKDLMQMMLSNTGIDGFIVDRFDLSQFAYDISWVPEFDKLNKKLMFKQLNKSVIEDFFLNSVYRSVKIHELYSEMFDIKYVVFKPSFIIKKIAMEDDSRRHDKYDDNAEYQNTVAKMIDFISKDEKEYDYLSSVCMDCKKRLPKNLLDKLIYIHEEKLIKFKINIKRLCTIDTDKLYENCLESPNKSKSRERVMENIDNGIVNNIIDYLSEN